MKRALMKQETTSFPYLLFAFVALAGCATPHEKMMSAALSGNEAELGPLLKQGGDVNVTAKTPHPTGPCAGSLTPLQLSACQGHAGVVRMLLANKADANLPNSGGETPLLQAASRGNRDIVRALLEGGARPDQRNASGQTALIVTDNAEIVRLLLAHKSDPNFTSSSGETALIQASSRGSAEVTRLLLQAGARPNARGVGGRTALVAATNVDTVRVLLANKADPNFTGATGETPLIQAAGAGNQEIVRLLLQAGARPNVRGPAGRTALMSAADADTAQLLLTHKADIAMQDPNGDTALLHAASNGRSNVVKLLLQHGADIDQKNKTGVNALAAALSGRNSETIALIRELDVNKKLAEGDRAAARGDHATALATYAAALPGMAEIGSAQERELRIKILRFASSMPTPPAVPDAAHEHVVRAEVYLKRGRSASEVEQELQQAIRLAPWWAEGYFNIGLVQANGNRFRDAIETLSLFIAGSPNHPNVRAAREKIVEFKIAQEEVDKVNALAGTWATSEGASYRVSVNGDKLTLSDSKTGITINATLRTGGAIAGSLQSTSYRGENNCTIPGQNHPVTGSVDRDGRSINLEYLWSSYSTKSHCVDMLGIVTFCCLDCSKVCSGVTISDTSSKTQRLYKRF